MTDTVNKADLLKQLRIDDSSDTTPGHESSHRSTTRPIIVVIIIATAVIAAGVWFLFQKNASSADVQTTNIASTSQQNTASNNTPNTSPPSLGSGPLAKTSKNQEEVLNASGYITPRRIATVSAEVMGLITRVDVEEGMHVTAGQVLANIDPAIAQNNYDLALAQARAAQLRLKSVQADIDEARRVLNRIDELKTGNFSSEAQRTRAETDLAKLQVLMAETQADIAILNLRTKQQKEILDNHTIRAPFDGVVTVKNAQPGEIVAPSSAGGGFTRTGICTIVDMDSLEIEVDVNEAFIGRVSEGQRVIAQLDAYPKWDIPARVIAIIPTADRAKATVRVRIGIDEKDTRILPDMGVKVAFMQP